MNTARSYEPLSTRPGTGQSRPYTRQSRPTSTSRPWTAQSRPGTARPQTAASTMHDASYIIALIESRGIAHEVGMAALDKDTGRVMLIQLSDCSTYVKTLHQMHVHPPSVILVPDTFISSTNASLTSSASAKRGPSSSSLSVQFIREEFPQVPIEPVPRKYWNDSAGYQFIAQFCVEDDERAATLVSVTDKYYTLSAACALFKFVETRLNTRFSACSLRIRYIPVEGTMMIDPETVRNLELINNQTRKKSTHSLFGVLNHTYTAMATRLLRTNILAPLIAQNALDARLDAVEELIHSEDKFTEIKDALKTLNKMDFDKLISSLGFSEVRPTTTAKGAFSRVSQMLNLRTAVRSLPFLQTALSGCKSQLLLVIYDILSDERLTKIEELVAENLNDDAGSVKGGIGAINARVFAVKANRNRLLDVARETFKENVTDIYQLNHTLSEQHSLQLSLVYQDSGFVFTIKKDELEDELPKGFINVSAQKGRWLFSSIDLKKMNARMKDSLEETLVLSDRIIQDVVGEIVAFSGVLYSASEAVATIDLLWSFAHVSIMRRYGRVHTPFFPTPPTLVLVRPEFTDTLAIKSGRHPVLETVQAAGMVVSNDIYCSDAAHFHIVQGPNMSGKSTYLRQTGLLTVMAMVGCFVPAAYASFRLHDSLLTRLSNDDDMEKSLSTFANEMTSSAMIIGIATSKTLVLIDELGRGTAPIEGLGIAHAIAEELIRLKCFVLFATHFHELSTTLSRQPTVVNLHLSVQRSLPSASNFGLTFQYKILDGVPENIGHYGLELAKLADLPDDVVSEARRVSEIITEKNLRCEEESSINILTIRRRALLKVSSITFLNTPSPECWLYPQLHSQLNQALDHSALPEEELVGYLARLQRDFMKTLKDTL
ncbi:muts domain V-domain-containing protein [Suillus paluster]|uniref:muts domain V-domain-containing protein n=1 Tax=Suillus paluster TaxID=48578 RepID=UPI001B8691B5|nr:muts domain V-domain-containing protein [Suillus paluster]KAG1741768.1 muts domain V-domain-containing protein [Suillus paluster]